MEKVEISNAVIESTQLGIEDHGFFNIALTLNYGGSGQGFGGWSVEKNVGKKLVAVDGAGIEMIKKILKVADADRWENLKGKFIRVQHTHSRVSALMHPLKDDIILDMDTFFPDYKKLIENQ